jgi:hypothetical protein
LKVEDATRTIQICLTPVGTAVLGSLVAGLLAVLLAALLLLGRRRGGDMAGLRHELSSAAGALEAMDASVSHLQSFHQQHTDRLFFGCSFP